MISTVCEGNDQGELTGVRAYISPSRLNSWLRCPLAFKLRYIDGVRSPPSKNMFLGKAVHAGLECYYRHRQVGVDLPASDVIQRMDADWGELADADAIQFSDIAEESRLQTKSASLVTAYLAQLPANEPAPKAVETALEAPLVDPSTGEDLGIGLLGVVDLIVDDVGGPLVCDFKTSARSGSPVEVMHEVQLTAYSYLFRQLSGESEAGLEIRSLIKTKVPKIEYHEYPARTDSHFRRFFQIVRAYLDDLDRGSFLYRPGFGCTMCDLRHGACSEICS